MLLHSPQRSNTAAGGGVEAPGQQLPAAGDVPDFTSLPPPPPPQPSLATTEGRLRTFREHGWPVDFLTAEEVAAAGFYSLGRGDDTVKCFYCDVVINSWERGDQPLVEHRKWSPRCPFLSGARRGCVDAVSYDSCSPFEPLRPQSRPAAAAKATPVHATRAAWPQYCQLDARLASFKDWPPAIPVKPAELSRAGFFYSGVGDRTVCYFCGRGLRDWEAGDDPWLEHELWFPGCWHVRLHRGTSFVEDVDRRRDALIAAKKNPQQAATDVTAKAPEPQAKKQKADDQAEKVEQPPTEENRLCKICYEKEMGVVFMPCGHIVACVDCALSVPDCPVCRQPFQNTLRVYLP